MTKTENKDQNVQAVNAHLGMIQAVIQRMAANSTSAKTWCITLVSAILVIVTNQGKAQYSLIAVIPTLLPLGYILPITRKEGWNHTTHSSINFIVAHSAGRFYSIKPSGDHKWEALKSFSIWPFYITLLVMIFIAKCFVIGKC